MIDLQELQAHGWRRQNRRAAWRELRQGLAAGLRRRRPFLRACLHALATLATLALWCAFVFVLLYLATA